jgi:hypothetical protein
LLAALLVRNTLALLFETTQSLFFFLSRLLLLLTLLARSFLLTALNFELHLCEDEK